MRRQCIVCNITFERNGRRQKLCEDCQSMRRREGVFKRLNKGWFYLRPSDNKLVPVKSLDTLDIHEQ